MKRVNMYIEEEEAYIAIAATVIIEAGIAAPGLGFAEEETRAERSAQTLNSILARQVQH
jgi:hypothetical protein